MAFTIEEIESAYKSNSNITYSDTLPTLQKTPNYPVVIDYLTGKSGTLQGLAPDIYMHYYTPLLSLLKNVEHPSTKDQLILGLVMDPTMSASFNYSFSWWLSTYALEHLTDSAYQAVIHQFRLAGHKDDSISQFLIRKVEHAGASYIDQLQNTAFRKFLLDHIRKSRTLVYDGWNGFYFSLLEEVNQNWASQYATDMAITYPDIILFLKTHKNGYYFPALVKKLDTENSGLLSEAKARFPAFVTLYETDEPRFSPMLVSMCKNYLVQFLAETSKYNWERNIPIKDLQGTGQRSYPLSACAVYFLLKYDKDYILPQLVARFEKKQFLPYRALEILHRQLKQDALPVLQLALGDETPAEGIGYFQKLFGLMQEHFAPGDYVPQLWKLTSTKSKPLKGLLANVLSADPEGASKAIALLDSKISETRQTAAMILRYFSTPAAVAAVNKVLQKEKNDDSRDILLQTVAASLAEQADQPFVLGVIEGAKERGKLNKPQEPWLEEAKLVPLYYKSGEALSADAVRFLLYRMSRVKGMRSDIEAKLLLNHIDKERAANFAKQLLLLFIENGMKSEQKYLLALAALLGNEELVDKIRTTTNNWLEENRTKMAEYGVGALALQGSDKALRWVEWYSRKYRNKKAIIGTTALQALEDAAEELAITTNELGDRIVPDFGFDGLFKHFIVGDDAYRAFIDSNFKIAFFDEDNKKLKSLPSGAPTELKEEFKDIAKEVRDVVKSQSLRLEHYLIVQRSWPFEQWQSFFLNNPVIFIYATRLLWGVYVNSQLVDCFLCQEDTTLVNLSDEEISIPDDADIRIVHPLYLSADLLQTWKRRFFDLSIEPIFPQLERPVVRLAETEHAITIVHRYSGKITESGAIKSTLEKYGWRKGATEDGGSVSAFHYADHESKLEALLEVEGVFVAGFDSDHNPTIGRLYFITAEHKKAGWLAQPKDDKDERLIPLHKVPAVFYSEVVSSVEAIKLKQASSVDATT